MSAPPESTGADRPQRRFDAAFRFLPLAPFDSIPGGSVVVLAPHPDDEIIGCGGALAMHAARGDRVTVVHLTDGGAGDHERRASGPIGAVRRAEAIAAGLEVGIEDYRALGFPDGGLVPSAPFASGLAGLLETLRPDVLYVPSPFELHPDHRGACVLADLALRHSSLDPAILLYEVNEPQQASFLLDITAVLVKKESALNRFESQRVYLDVADKAILANRARTVNVDLAEVKAAEAYRRIGKRDLGPWIDAVEGLHGFAAGLGRAAAATDASARATAPISCVISTWNKKDDVRENLLALARQELLPAEVVVVDNASKDGTAAMIRAEFPAVKLIVMEHDRKGACETFNIGMKAATQPFTAIMDDDVVAPPSWLRLLHERMLAEPSTTAMVSSKVVEPGMPREFLESPAVNRERYMATFRGCGTLARSDVLKAAGYYDERFFIYGNERDLAARVLALGHRILQYPSAEIFHKTPFGLKAGKRSLYYHVRNFWLYAFKHCSWGQVLHAGFTLGAKGLGLRRGVNTDATGTIGIDRSVKETPGGLWIAVKATLAAIAMLPYCLKHRRVNRAPDFEPPV